MEWKFNPKNENLTIRISKNEKKEFTELAKINQTSRSNWARNILVNNKENYMKSEDINPILYGLEVAFKSLNYINDKLAPTNVSTDENHDLLLKKGEIQSEIRKLEKLKKRIEN